MFLYVSYSGGAGLHSMSPVADVRMEAAAVGSGWLGTRFLVFPQPPFIPGYERPEPVWIATPPDRIGPGPADRRIYVIDPLVPKEPYGFPFLPPCRSACYPPPEPGPDGHYDHLPPDSRGFLSAHAFACVHRVLDICENYWGSEIPWFFEPDYDRLEVVPRIPWNNAQSGFGYLELGEDDSRDEPIPYALNFDAIAHETGHLVLLGVLGTPRGAPSQEFLAYHEAVADFLSLLGLLHFDTAVDRILRRTRGNLYIVNELDRFAELGDEKQIRVLSHSLKAGDVGAEVHDFSKPFAGALFDSLLEIFQLLLLERGLSDLDTREIEEVRVDLTQADIDREILVSRDSYELRHFAVKSALVEARDLVGETLARSWRMLGPDGLSFAEAADAVVATAEAGRARRFAARIHQNFAWRLIV